MFDRHQTPARFLAATLAGAALFIAAPAAAQYAHGVIAFGDTDQGDGVAYGFAWNFPAKDTANVEAVNACISSGGTNCIQLAWFQNGCGALAIDQHGNAQGKPGMTREQAEARALRTCEAAGGVGCNIVGSLCATPDGDPGTYSGSESVLQVQGPQRTVAGPADELLTREERVLVQQTLTALGFDAGPADGIFGRRTRAAIVAWQNANGHESTGYVSREQVTFLTAADAAPGQEQEPLQEAADNQSGNVLIFGPATGPICIEGESTEEGYCWHEFANKSGCFFLEMLSAHETDTTFTWSGNCLNGAANGLGTFELIYYGDYIVSESTGEMAQGYRQGHWLVRDFEMESVAEGPYVDGKKHGHWVLQWHSGKVLEGPYVDGRRHGHFVLRNPSGSFEEGPYVDGKRHGHWVAQLESGQVMEGPFVDGKRHGRWVSRRSDGRFFWEKVYERGE